jgi:hypothetical protein
MKTITINLLAILLYSCIDSSSNTKDINTALTIDSTKKDSVFFINGSSLNDSSIYTMIKDKNGRIYKERMWKYSYHKEFYWVDINNDSIKYGERINLKVRPSWRDSKIKITFNNIDYLYDSSKIYIRDKNYVVFEEECNRKGLDSIMIELTQNKGVIKNFKYYIWVE